MSDTAGEELRQEFQEMEYLLAVSAFFGEFRLNELEQYVQVSETYLQKARADFVAWADEQQTKLSPEERDEFGDFWSDEYWRYTDRLPRILRNSFLVSAFTLFEYEMGRICNQLRKAKKIPFGWNDLRGNVLERLKKYFELAGLSLREKDQVWQRLDNYIVVRNCIVHNNGLVKGSKGEKQLRAYAAEKSILADDTIEQEVALSEKFCREVIETMRIFWRQLAEWSL